MLITIYAIESSATPLVYVGLTCRPETRVKQHWYDLKRGDHSNPILADEVRLFGIACLTSRVLEVCGAAESKFREQFWINVFAKTKYVANLRPSSGLSPWTGKSFTAEHRQKLAAARRGKKGRPLSREESARMNALHKPYSPERREEKRRLANSPGGLAAKKRKPVLNLTTGDLYASATEAAETIGVSVSTLTDACTGRLVQVRGQKFTYIKH